MYMCTYGDVGNAIWMFSTWFTAGCLKSSVSPARNLHGCECSEHADFADINVCSPTYKVVPLRHILSLLIAIVLGGSPF